MSGVEHLGLFIVAGLLLNLTPGPDVLFVVSQSLRAGRRAGMVAALGVAAGIFVHILAAGLGLSAVLASSATAFTVLKWLGVAYLLYFRLLGSASPSRALAVTYLIPLFAVSYGVTLLDEPFTAGMGLSALVILLGTAMATGMIAPDALLQRFRKRPDSP